jgi:hypothetical protein
MFFQVFVRPLAGRYAQPVKLYNSRHQNVRKMLASFSSPVMGSLRFGMEAASAVALKQCTKADPLNIIVRLAANFGMDPTLLRLLFSETLEFAVVNF